MREKRNKDNPFISTEGYIKKYFGTDIGRILTPSNRSLQNCEIPYVPHLEAEMQLKNCLERDLLKDKSFVFTGLTGSGKSTIIRHVFGLERNSNKSIIQGKTLIIPIDFNKIHSAAQDAIFSNLQSAVKKVSDSYCIDFPDSSNKDFYEYISDRRNDFLYLDPKNNNSTTYLERMNIFLEKIPVAFVSLQLQYVMDHQNSDLELVVLIIDNVEAFRSGCTSSVQSKYLLPIIEAFQLTECIGQRGESTEWSFNLVIACRHHIWRIMKGEFTDNSQENALLQSYVTTEKPYDLSKPVKINDIVKKREEVFSVRQRDPQKWEVAIKVVNTIFQMMDNSIGDFIVQLELKDLRKSMMKMTELIFYNGLQRKPDEEILGAFQIDSVDQFDLSRVNLIKTIGLSDKKYYSENSIIPNLLLNEKQEDSELYLLLTLKYFLIQCGNEEPNWDNSASINRFYLIINRIFKTEEKDSLQELFRYSVQYLIKHRLLLRSADQHQDEVPGLTLDEIKKIEFVYVSGAAIKLWTELEKSSALFQLFMDDIWLDKDSNYFNEDGNSIEHCVEYLEVLFRQERKIFNIVKSCKSTVLYIEAFGSGSICKRLVRGLIASLEVIVASSYEARVNTNKVYSAKRTLEKARKLSKQLDDWIENRKG